MKCVIAIACLFAGCALADGAHRRAFYSLVSNPSAVVLPDVTRGLVAQWKLDDNAANTTVVDSYGSYGGTLLNSNSSVMNVTGLIDGAFSFPQTFTNRVNVTSVAALNPYPMTLMAWEKTTSKFPANVNAIGFVAGKYVSGSNNGYWMGPFAGKAYCGYFGSGTHYTYGQGASATILTNGLWHLLAMVVSTNGTTIYIDGIQDGLIAWTGTPLQTSTSQAFHIGNQSDNSGDNGYAWVGTIDETRLYAVALSSNEILTVYNKFNP